MGDKKVSFVGNGNGEVLGVGLLRPLLRQEEAAHRAIAAVCHLIGDGKPCQGELIVLITVAYLISGLIHQGQPVEKAASGWAASMARRATVCSVSAPSQK